MFLSCWRPGKRASLALLISRSSASGGSPRSCWYTAENIQLSFSIGLPCQVSRYFWNNWYYLQSNLNVCCRSPLASVSLSNSKGWKAASPSITRPFCRLDPHLSGSPHATALSLSLQRRRRRAEDASRSSVFLTQRQTEISCDFVPSHLSASLLRKRASSSSSCVFIQRVAVLEMNLLLDYWNKKLIKLRVSYWLGFSLRQSSAERRESKGFIFSFFLPDGLCERMKCVILELWLQKMLNTRLQTRGSLLDHKSAV